ncbi:MAG: flagellar hook-basal body complex protein FliE [Alphaproteobacteria bacterium]|nr:flagellar hook-basal body complex protein FliE [Alphaproteobacteria bacterium]
MPLDKLVDPTAAAKAYTSLQNLGGKSSVAGDGAGDISFSDFMKGNIEDSIKTLKNSEAISAKAVTGEADLTDVVQAVTSAEMTLQTVVSIRDKLITAYQEIMRMPM